MIASRCPNLTIALPAKGQLFEGSMQFLAHAGLTIIKDNGARGYNGHIEHFNEARVIFLSAKEIATALYSGQAHIGITGEDMVREVESGDYRPLTSLAALGFGRADVVVAVPQSWIDVTTMTDLGDVARDFYHNHRRNLRVSTKYLNLTRDFFRKHNINAYNIVKSFGATEGAPAAGVTDLIVDITTTGTTLKANRLRAIADGVVLASEAKLVLSPSANWNDAIIQSLRHLLNQIEAAQRARQWLELRALVNEPAVALKEISANHQILEPFYPTQAPMLLLHLKRSELMAVVAVLKKHHAKAVTVSNCEYIFSDDNQLFTLAMEALKRSY